MLSFSSPLSVLARNLVKTKQNKNQKKKKKNQNKIKRLVRCWNDEKLELVLYLPAKVVVGQSDIFFFFFFFFFVVVEEKGVLYLNESNDNAHK